MNVTGIIELEEGNEGSILLHREGLFWRAYEQSAFLFCTRIKAYQVKKKYFKNVNTHIVMLGFPNNALDAIIKSVNGKPVLQEEKLIIIGGYQTDKDNFLAWKSGIDVSEDTTTIESAVSENQQAYLHNPENMHVNGLLKELQKFPVVSKTPIECQQFIIELQKQLHGTIQ